MSNTPCTGKRKTYMYGSDIQILVLNPLWEINKCVREVLNITNFPLSENSSN